jgi:hypothetical protein
LAARPVRDNTDKPVPSAAVVGLALALLCGFIPPPFSCSHSSFGKANQLVPSASDKFDVAPLLRYGKPALESSQRPSVTLAARGLKHFRHGQEVGGTIMESLEHIMGQWLVAWHFNLDVGGVTRVRVLTLVRFEKALISQEDHKIP